MGLKYELASIIFLALLGTEESSRVAGETNCNVYGNRLDGPLPEGAEGC